MKGFARSVPLAAWLTALPQLISRLCHPHPEVAALARSVVQRLLEAFPQQALWALAAAAKSPDPARKAAAAAATAAARQAAGGAEARRLFAEFPQLAEQLIRLCNDQTPPDPRKKAHSARRQYAHLVRSLPLGVMVPTAAALTAALPPGGAAPDARWRAFGEAVTIAGLEDTVLVMASLQKPKRVVFIGSDGARYAFLAKPKDDLRKDARIVEIAGVVNRLFTVR
jgi:serine/threonine-protein kinase ATR